MGYMGWRVKGDTTMKDWQDGNVYVFGSALIVICAILAIAVAKYGPLLH